MSASTIPGPSAEELRLLLAPVLGGHVEAFLAGGLAAVAADRGQCWVHVGLAVRSRPREVFHWLGELSAELLDDPAVTNFFFMRKPPGVRLRFEAAHGQRLQVESMLHSCLGQARLRVERVVPGVYEPEEHLFGGPASMPFVHRIFTIDSLAWLAFWRLETPGPPWAFSLSLLRYLLDGVGVVGWEDLGVWDLIRSRTGRALPPGMDAGKLAAACAGIRDTWSDPSRLEAGLPAPVAALAAEWGPRLRAAGEDWRSGYFDTRGAMIGPRDGVTFVTIFHWNRGGVSAATQSLLAAALADRSARP
jgi:thiopeptide-type bacteriocin biosynthesis protein